MSSHIGKSQHISIQIMSPEMVCLCFRINVDIVKRKPTTFQIGCIAKVGVDIFTCANREIPIETGNQKQIIISEPLKDNREISGGIRIRLPLSYFCSH